MSKLAIRLYIGLGEEDICLSSAAAIAAAEEADVRCASEESAAITSQR